MDIGIYRNNIRRQYRTKQRTLLHPLIKEAMGTLLKDVDIADTKYTIDTIIAPTYLKEAQGGDTANSMASLAGKSADYMASLLLFGPLVLGIPLGYLWDRISTPSQSDMERRQNAILKTEYEEAMGNLATKLDEREHRREIKGLSDFTEASPKEIRLI